MTNFAEPVVCMYVCEIREILPTDPFMRPDTKIHMCKRQVIGLTDIYYLWNFILNWSGLIILFDNKAGEIDTILSPEEIDWHARLQPDETYMHTYIALHICRGALLNISLS